MEKINNELEKSIKEFIKKVEGDDYAFHLNIEGRDLMSRVEILKFKGRDIKIRIRAFNKCIGFCLV